VNSLSSSSSIASLNSSTLHFEIQNEPCDISIENLPLFLSSLPKKHRVGEIFNKLKIHLINDGERKDPIEVSSAVDFQVLKDISRLKNITSEKIDDIFTRFIRERQYTIPSNIHFSIEALKFPTDENFSYRENSVNISGSIESMRKYFLESSRTSTYASLSELKITRRFQNSNHGEQLNIEGVFPLSALHFLLNRSSHFGKTNIWKDNIVRKVCSSISSENVKRRSEETSPQKRARIEKNNVK